MTTTVVYADTSDGHVWSARTTAGYDPGANYSSVREGYNLGFVTNLPYLDAGQYSLYDSDYDDTSVVVMETCLSFDTSAIGDTDTVSAVVLTLTSGGDASDTDFTIEARLHDWGAALDTSDWVPGADLSGKTLLASRATSSGFGADTAYDFTSESAFATNVSKTGSTRLLLCSSRTTNNNTPTEMEMVSIKSADTSGTTSDPKLTVTHAAGATDPALKAVVTRSY